MSIITNLELQKKFDTAIENSVNKNILIENEIREIENYVNNIPVYSFSLKKSAKPLTMNKSPKVFDFGKTYIDRKIFNESFHDYLRNAKPITIERLYDESDETYRIKQNSSEQAIETFKYYEWLRIKLTKKAKQSISFNHEEKLLALLYLGLNTTEYDNTKCAKILNAIIGLSEQNTREMLSYLYNDGINNPVRTKKHLEKVSKQFENQGLTVISNKIKEDIKNLK
ncbi:hypothetical protein [Yeosuana sp.]|uniref:hypothetical protein n=1 Tax=Yeosuana sp. TaxID=2529388 RepID=UPI004054E8BF